jgi:hypothetical protein
MIVCFQCRRASGTPYTHNVAEAGWKVSWTKNIFNDVIPSTSSGQALSGVFPTRIAHDARRKNGVEGSHVVWLTGECPEILRLRKSPLRYDLLRSG